MAEPKDMRMEPGGCCSVSCVVPLACLSRYFRKNLVLADGSLWSWLRKRQYGQPPAQQISQELSDVRQSTSAFASCSLSALLSSFEIFTLECGGGRYEEA